MTAALVDVRPVAQAAPLTVSVVTYHPDLGMIAATLASLRPAALAALRAGCVGHVLVELIDNGCDDPHALEATARAALGEAPGLALRMLHGHGNVGYGRGHNLSILTDAGGYHLVLNPDVLLDEDALVQGIRFLEANADVGMIAPHVRDAAGAQQYLCRDYPTVFLLFLRGFAPAPVRRLFRRYMEAHELRGRIGDQVVRDVPLISGCFMLGRREVLRRVGGFSPEYFLYFEDSDLSLAVRRVAGVAYVPSMRIVHFGGGAARKGMAHVRMFMAAAGTFFRRNGWKLF